MAAALNVIDRAETAALLLNGERKRLLEELGEPESAAGLARRLGMSRQIVNYHLKELEKAGLIRLAEERRKGNCIERVMERAAVAYVIDPAVLGPLDADPAAVADKLSAAYLMAVAARSIRDVSRLSRQAAEARKILPTLTLETEVRFRNAGERDAFVRELTGCIAHLVEKYHAGAERSGRSFRFVTTAYPATGGKEKRDERG